MIIWNPWHGCHKTFRIPDKRTQSLQAYKSGLSYKGNDIDFKLMNPEPGLFDIEAHVPSENIVKHVVVE